MERSSCPAWHRSSPRCWRCSSSASRSGPGTAAGLLIAVAGLLLVVGPAAGGAERRLEGDLMFLAGAALWGIYSVLARIASRRFDAVSATLYGTLTGTALLVPLAAAGGRLRTPGLGDRAGLDRPGLPRALRDGGRLRAAAGGRRAHRGGSRQLIRAACADRRGAQLGAHPRRDPQSPDRGRRGGRAHRAVARPAPSRGQLGEELPHQLAQPDPAR